jgi:hypothetical protein
LLPEIERQQQQDKEVVFRADPAFAKPEIYEALEERDVKYAIRLPERQPGAQHYGVVDSSGGKAQLQAGSPLHELSLPGGQFGRRRGGW